MANLLGLVLMGLTQLKWHNQVM